MSDAVPSRLSGVESIDPALPLGGHIVSIGRRCVLSRPRKGSEGWGYGTAGSDTLRHTESGRGKAGRGRPRQHKTRTKAEFGVQRRTGWGWAKKLALVSRPPEANGALDAARRAKHDVCLDRQADHAVRHRCRCTNSTRASCPARSPSGCLLCRGCQLPRPCSRGRADTVRPADACAQDQTQRTLGDKPHQSASFHPFLFPGA